MLHIESGSSMLQEIIDHVTHWKRKLLVLRCAVDEWDRCTSYCASLVSKR